jgi:Na+/melibiose symporter-like transporter
MTGRMRACWWGLAVLGACAAVGLVVWVTAAHPEGAGQAWGAVGAVAGVAAVVVSLWQLRAAPAPVSPPGSAAPPSPVEQVTGERGAIVARGNVSGSSTRHIGTPPAPPAATTPSSGPEGLTGRDSAIVAGEDVTDSHTDYRS